MAGDDSAADLLSGTTLYYSCIGYAVNLSTPTNYTLNGAATEGNDVDAESSPPSVDALFSMQEMRDACEVLLQTLYRPTHDPRRYARELLTYLLMGVAGSTVGCFGLVGNLLSLIVLTRRTMRTSTYCYLAALAVCDLLAVFCMLILLIKVSLHSMAASFRRISSQM